MSLRERVRRLEKVMKAPEPPQPFTWFDFRERGPMPNEAESGGAIVFGLFPKDQIPEECEWIWALGWCWLDDEHRAKFQAEGRLIDTTGQPRIWRDHLWPSGNWGGPYAKHGPAEDAL